MNFATTLMSRSLLGELIGASRHAATLAAPQLGMKLERCQEPLFCSLDLLWTVALLRQRRQQHPHDRQPGQHGANDLPGELGRDALLAYPVKGNSGNPASFSTLSEP